MVTFIAMYNRFIYHIFIFLVTVAFTSSCKKDYNCRCEVVYTTINDDSSHDGEIVLTVISDNKRKADDTCDAMEDSYYDQSNVWWARCELLFTK